MSSLKSSWIYIVLVRQSSLYTLHCTCTAQNRVKFFDMPAFGLQYMLLADLCCSRKYPYPYHGRFFKFNPPPPPPRTPPEIQFQCHTCTLFQKIVLLKDNSASTPFIVRVQPKTEWSSLTCLPLAYNTCYLMTCVVPENIHTLTMEGFLNSTPHPSGNSISVSYMYFLSKNWAFEPPLPLGISINLPWGGHGYFLELHIVTFEAHLVEPQQNAHLDTA